MHIILFLSLYLLPLLASDQKTIKVELTAESNQVFDPDTLILKDTNTGQILDFESEEKNRKVSINGEDIDPELLDRKIKMMEELNEMYDEEAVKGFFRRVNSGLSRDVEFLEFGKYHVLVDVSDFTKEEEVRRHRERKVYLYKKAIAVGSYGIADQMSSDAVVLDVSVPAGSKYEMKLALFVMPEFEKQDKVADLQIYGLDNYYASELKEIVGILARGAIDTKDSWSGSLADTIALLGDKSRIFSKCLLEDEKYQGFSDLFEKMKMVYKDWMENGMDSNLDKYRFEEIPKEEWFNLIKYVTICIYEVASGTNLYHIELGEAIEQLSVTDKKASLQAWNTIHDFFEVTLRTQVIKNAFNGAVEFFPEELPVYILVTPQTKDIVLDHLHSLDLVDKESWTKGDLSQLDCSFLEMKYCFQEREDL